MNQLFDPKVIESFLDGIREWTMANVFNVGNLVQLAVIVAMFALARLAEPRLVEVLQKLKMRLPYEQVTARFVRVFIWLCLPIVWVMAMWLSFVVAVYFGWPNHIINIGVSLVGAWAIIRMASGLIRHGVWARWIAAAAWTIAALNIVDLLGPTVDLLDSIAISFDNFRVSVLLIVKGIVALALLLWSAVFFSDVLERRIEKATSLTPSIQVLLGKLLKIVLIAIAVIAALSTVGIDISAFAIFGGALGVGIGFGLQKVVSNLISGIILLLDKSIKPGDVIAVANTYGWIKSLGARYASVITRDGTEHLIPNEDLITQRVENWSYSSNLVRLRIPVGVSYNTDVRKAMECCLEAAAAIERVQESPKPACLMKGFGDSAIDLEVRIWINDPINGISNVKSDVLLGIWDRFREHGIEIPFPQRDVHIKSGRLDAAASPRPAEPSA